MVKLFNESFLLLCLWVLIPPICDLDILSCVSDTFKLFFAPIFKFFVSTYDYCCLILFLFILVSNYRGGSMWLKGSISRPSGSSKFEVLTFCSTKGCTYLGLGRPTRLGLDENKLIVECFTFIYYCYGSCCTISCLAPLGASLSVAVLKRTAFFRFSLATFSLLLLNRPWTLDKSTV